jgi:hypothetical protein
MYIELVQMKNCTKSIKVLILLLLVLFSAASAEPDKALLLKYQDYSCEQIEQELFLVDYKIPQYKTNLQHQDYNQGICWTSILLLSGEAGSGLGHQKLAQLKREYDALEFLAKQKECHLGAAPVEENKYWRLPS